MKLLLIQLIDITLINNTVKINMHKLPNIYAFTLALYSPVPVSFWVLKPKVLVFLKQQKQQVTISHYHHQSQIHHHLAFNASNGRRRYNYLPCS